jgi:hypothetical protein
MGNFIFGYSLNKDNKFLDYTPSADSEDPIYPATNLKLYGNPKQKWQGLVATDTVITLAFGAAKTVLAIALIDVNFTACYITENGTFRNPAVSGNLTIIEDTRTGRYNAYIALTAFNFANLKLHIPTQTPLFSETVFRIGSIVCLDTSMVLTNNPREYDIEVDEKMKTNEFESGGYEDINYGDLFWQGTMNFNAITSTQETQFMTLNDLKKDQFLLFYENSGDTSRVYVCKRRTVIGVTSKPGSLKDIKSITFREMI